MNDHINKQIHQYFGRNITKMKALGITKSAVFTYVLRVQGGWSKESALRALLQGRTLDSDQIKFVCSVLEKLPSASEQVHGAGA